MFNSAYHFVNIGCTKYNPFLNEIAFIKTLHFKFKTPQRIYLLDIRCYANSLYVIEYYLRADKNNKKYSKFGKLTNDGRPTTIVRTCFEVMLSLLQVDKKASFAFIGSPTYCNDVQIEDIDTTKRFKIYRYVSINLLGEKSFEQFGDDKTSCYLIANNKVDKSAIRQQASIILSSLF